MRPNAEKIFFGSGIVFEITSKGGLKMIKTKMIVVLFLIGGMIACVTAPKEPLTTPKAAVRDSHEGLNGVLWVQTAAEYQTLARVAFSLAKSALDNALQDKSWTAALEQTGSGDYSSKNEAIIVDIDETILDNSPYQARLVKERSTFNKDLWKLWTEKHIAAPVPGADDFLKYANSRGVTVFYITNRDTSEEADTRRNLSDLNLPIRADLDVVLTKNENNWTSSDKSQRRAKVCEDFRVLLLIGDDLGDFVSGAKDSPQKRVQLAQKYNSYWGVKWILIPNPLYGSWESALYGNDYNLSDKDILDKKLNQLKDF